MEKSAQKRAGKGIPRDGWGDVVRVVRLGIPRFIQEDIEARIRRHKIECQPYRPWFETVEEFIWFAMNKELIEARERSKR